MAVRVRSESAQRVSGCVTALLREQPFFGSLALRLPVRADAGRETLASDGREIRYSPQWIAETDAHVIETAIARVVLACALKHHTRRGERDPERWQRASQLVTHGLLRDAGFTLPPDAEAWDGISVEEAYDRLPEPDEDESGDGNPPDGGGGSGADAAGAPMSDGSEPADEGDDGEQPVRVLARLHDRGLLQLRDGGVVHRLDLEPQERRHVGVVPVGLEGGRRRLVGDLRRRVRGHRLGQRDRDRRARDGHVRLRARDAALVAVPVRKHDREILPGLRGGIVERLVEDDLQLLPRHARRLRLRR